ncbi:protein kinase [Planobispora siamensis]|nr:serine/threonine-protein kinase [Planobispora siamensis]
MQSDGPQEGRRVAGRYHLLEPIGRGGMGTVWKAHDELLDRTVAIKEVRYSAALGEDIQTLNRRMMREARAAARLTHPNVVIVYDVIEENEQPWIVMQLVPSRSLGQVLREDGPLPPRRVAEIGLALLEALRNAHDAGVLHRDVKPENVLLAHNGRVVLTDFGIATLDSESTLTMTGVAGTPAFIAPERLRGLPARRESDLWSLGATLYAAVEGRSPHDRKLPLPTMHSVMTDPPDPAHNAGPLLPVLEGLLRKEPIQRLTYSEASAMLRRVVEGHSSTQPWAVPPIATTRKLPSPPAERPSSTPSEGGPERRKPYGAAPGGKAPAGKESPAGKQTPAAPAGDRSAPAEPASQPKDAAKAAGAAAAIPQTGHVARPPAPPEASAAESPAMESRAMESRAMESPAERPPSAEAPAEKAPAGKTPSGKAAPEEAPASAEEASGEAAPASSTRQYVKGLAAEAADPTPPMPSARPSASSTPPPAAPVRPPAPSTPAPSARPSAPEPVPVPVPEPEPLPAVPYEDATPAEQTRLSALVSPSGMRRALPVIIGALLLVGALGVWIGMNSGETGASGRDPSPAATEDGTGDGSSSGGGSESPQSATPSEDDSPSADPSETAEDKGKEKEKKKKEDGDKGALPSGWKTHKDPNGFSVGLPKGWTVERRQGTQVRFRGPDDSFSYLMIEYTDTPGSDAKKDWDEYEPQARANFPGYKLIGIKRVDYMADAADWEFTWQARSGKARVVNRGFLTGKGRGYAIYWHTYASKWEQNLKLFEGFTETFSSKK